MSKIESSTTVPNADSTNPAAAGHVVNTNVSAERTQSRSDVHEVLERLDEAVRSGNLDEILSYYADDTVAFDMMPPLRFKDMDQWRDVAWRQCFTSYFQFPLKRYETTEENLEVRDDIAMFHCLVHMEGVSRKGEAMESWLRRSAFLKKIDGKWLVTHEHNSVPLSLENGEGLMKLPPDDQKH